MDRRFFLQALTMLGGSYATAAIAGLAGSSQAAAKPLAIGPSIDELPSDLFSEQERKDLSAMAEVIIPRTESPGAIDAGVPKFIEYMVQNWLSEAEQQIFLEGFRAIQKYCLADFSKSFSALHPNQQLDILEDLEDKASDSPWYDFANVQRQYIEDAPFICQLKELTIFGFYSSEVGAKQVLRHDPMPMQFDGEYALGEEDSSWSMIRTM
ncbi:gluconate 2-dehydrogenase subunit 3 family protein [uncultured Pseudoteredinibacter sp.]|uniref:gluconate 2-dehydrogenase subunit 3 family protein n=1 Tax=uncultured Pseudoteredinibacter sp. TaxID=1641701 RepID=UPI0026145E76|nr:gluconate 2-dehydrogenase subunit 3 family protein [uncultured Pseudoteredinibacter sp.]